MVIGAGLVPEMKVISSISEMFAYSRKVKDRGQKIGFVPTMGFFHDGHLALISQAKKQCDIVIVSIFVNPLQFGPKEDFKTYPRNLGRDKKTLEAFDPIVLFIPKANEFASENLLTSIEVGEFSKKLCGKSRPGHFKGVATIVCKLFNVVKPDFAYFGEKDFQQQLIIKKLTEDLNYEIKIITVKTVREEDGLAMSSRNSYLNPRERKAAPILYKSLQKAKESIEGGERDGRRIHYLIAQILGREPIVRIDYIAICDPKTMEEVKSINDDTLITLAVHVGHTRLIDNIVIHPK